MGQENKEKKEKKPKKSRRGLRGFLCILQHTALAVLALSVFVVITGSTVRVQGFRSNLGFSLYSSDQKVKYEESELFNSLFGYAVTDVVRMGVISGQLETNGDFDGSKVIDVTAYNYRETELPKQFVTATYRLDDLLKWAKYGFEYSNTEMTEEQAGRFLSDKTRVTMIDTDSKYYNTSDASYLKSDIGSYTFVNDVSANMIRTGNDTGYGDGGYVDADYKIIYSENGEITTTSAATVIADESGAILEDDEDEISEKKSYSILVNRYKTTEGKNLEEYVSDWNLYRGLCENVQSAAASLAYNYGEYTEYKEYYSTKNSNVRYLIAKTVGKNTEYYSNLDEKDREEVIEAMESASETDDIAFPAGKYIYYNPAQMIFRTNTAVTEDTVRNILRQYDYAYPDTVRLWVGVDTDYPVKDSFTQGAAGFHNYMPVLWQWVIAAFAAGVLYLILLCALTVTAGRDVDTEGKPCIRLTGFDHVPTEAALLIGCGVAVLIVWILIVVTELANVDISSLYFDGETVYEYWFKVLLFVGIFIADAIFTFFFYSLVRRIKAGELWKNSFLRRLVKKAQAFAWKVYDNGNIVIRTWIPYGLFVLFNLLMTVIMLWYFDNEFLIFCIIAAVDIAVGILIYHDTKERQEIVKGIEKIVGGDMEYQIGTDKFHGDNLTLASSVNSIGKGIKDAVEISMKDERMKADLITNVSHDIKTPLTSIINYVDLIKREEVDNEKVQNYIRVLDEKSQRLKQLTDDLVEASKISSGNIHLNIERINLTELMNQTIGEFSEKFEQRNLTTVMNVHTKHTVIEADSRQIWRVIENLFNNVFKYAMTGTRIYIAIDQPEERKQRIELSIKNISALPLNCNPEDLTERFIRGDVSRTTEGSGLGLSIAKSLTEAQNGTFEIQLDGDLFKVVMTFPAAKEE